MANNQPEQRTEDMKSSKGGTGISAGDENIFSKENAKYFKPVVGAAVGATNVETHKGRDHFDTYGFLSGVGTTYSFALGAEKGSIGPGFRPSYMLMGLGITGVDSLIDHTLFKGVDRKAPTVIADGLAMGIAFTPQPLYMKAAEMVGIHTAGRFIDKLLD